MEVDGKEVGGSTPMAAALHLLFAFIDGGHQLQEQMLHLHLYYIQRFCTSSQLVLEQLTSIEGGGHFVANIAVLILLSIFTFNCICLGLQL